MFHCINASLKFNKLSFLNLYKPSDLISNDRQKPLTQTQFIPLLCRIFKHTSTIRELVMVWTKLRTALKLRPVSYFVRTNEIVGIASLYLSLVNNTHKRAGVKTVTREWRNIPESDFTEMKKKRSWLGKKTNLLYTKSRAYLVYVLFWTHSRSFITLRST